MTSRGPRGLLSPELEELLRTCARRQKLVKHEMLFTHGSVPNALYCVDQGLVRLSVTGCNGREAVLGVLEPGQWFGEASLFTDTPHDHNAYAVVDSEVLRVPVAEFHEIVDQRPAFMLEFTRLICSRYKWALQWIDSTILQPFPVRLAQRLLTSRRILYRSAAAETDVLRLSQEDLAHMLGISRPSVNKQLKEWEARNILKLEYGRITLLDTAALERVVREG